MQCELCKSNLQRSFRCGDEIVDLVDISRPKCASYVILECKRKPVVFINFLFYFNYLVEKGIIK